MASKDSLEFYKICLEAHGYAFLQDEINEDKSESDEESRSMKPPPIPYNEFKHKIIQITDDDAVAIHKTDFISLNRDERNKKSESIKPLPLVCSDNDVDIIYTTDAKRLSTCTHILNKNQLPKENYWPENGIFKLNQDLCISVPPNNSFGQYNMETSRMTTSALSMTTSALSKTRILNQNCALDVNTNILNKNQLPKENYCLENGIIKPNQDLRKSAPPNKSLEQCNVETTSRITTSAPSKTQTLNQNCVLDVNTNILNSNQLPKENYWPKNGIFKSNQALRKSAPPNNSFGQCNMETSRMTTSALSMTTTALSMTTSALSMTTSALSMTTSALSMTTSALSKTRILNQNCVLDVNTNFLNKNQLPKENYCPENGIIKPNQDLRKSAPLNYSFGQCNVETTRRITTSAASKTQTLNQNCVLDVNTNILNKNQLPKALSMTKSTLSMTTYAPSMTTSALNKTRILNQNCVLDVNTNILNKNQLLTENYWLENGIFKSNQNLRKSAPPNNSFGQCNVETTNRATTSALSKTRILNQNCVLDVKNIISIDKKLSRQAYCHEGRHEPSKQSAIFQERSVCALYPTQVQIANKIEIPKKNSLAKKERNIPYQMSSTLAISSDDNMETTGNVTSAPREIQDSASDVYKSVDSKFIKFQEKRTYINKRKKRAHGCVII